ncbi:Multicopper oxidase with three cupredoxin domains (includes cell division protein FtsP and spore coat protein CotA) [Verrucomicrobium sp. GAS474]|uniref:multicopper oxidase family protein n=1 Tax=Verrucomicrobium sp. GAS474 TaxID=1882831 RepID=UPI00087BEA00|nr:copper oxidase [Verrucomicrobium sp. GAS474]SDT90838.1 Multicopper oxidase with three cupredoxin domains (includes cell division protein FtsP and spore coat protein CotA) [Verrucomicrobium sp. GAS474]
MNLSRRQLLAATGLTALTTTFFGKAQSALAAISGTEPTPPPPSGNGSYTPVVTPNGTTLPWTMKDGVKEFRLVAEPVKREFAPGMIVNCWGYNGQTPGPTIEAVEGDRIRIFVTNKLNEPTSVHWHGIFLPNGMDGVSGLTQKSIEPDETYVYEFTLRQHGTYMYHPHSDEMVQMAVGMMGFFIIHPKGGEETKIDRDFALFLMEWAVDPGTATPRASVMTDFNTFTFNSRAYPGTDPLIVKLGQRVRIRVANLSMDSHPIHIHGHRYWVTQTDGGQIPKTAWWPETSVNVPPGTTRTMEFVADNPGDWAFHCHKSHHTMNAMAHDIPNLLGVEQDSVTKKIKKLVPGYMEMGTDGMGEMGEMQMKGPKNTLAMMTGTGPFGPVEMGGMFTVVKIRENLASYDDPGWYKNPAGTMAKRIENNS